MVKISPPALTVQLVQHAGQVVLAAEGEIDLSTVVHFRRALAEAGELHAPTLIVDLAAVRYLDSSAIYALLETWAARNRDPTRLQIVVARPSLGYALRLAGLEAVVRVG